tara:strand:- start:699 stop:941 length:243 start_codon:yes stop_codon:yes gene_type:complete
MGSPERKLRCKYCGRVFLSNTCAPACPACGHADTIVEIPSSPEVRGGKRITRIGAMKEPTLLLLIMFAAIVLTATWQVCG